MFENSPAGGTERVEMTRLPSPGNSILANDALRSSSDPLNVPCTSHDSGTNNNGNAARVLQMTVQSSTEVRQIPERTVRRKLRGIHLFMITINGTLGTGLYVRSGQMLELGGPVAVILSFVLLGFLAWAVMQCIAELLCEWPVPGAVPLFVRMFVDKELGDAVGVAYWFTYSVGFSALIAISASILNYWTAGIPGVTEPVIYVLLPVVLVLINMCEVEIYGWFEVVTGFIKIGFLVIILFCLGAIYSQSGIPHAAASDWLHPTVYDKDASIEWGPAIIMSLSIAIFAYTGVEIIAASVIEADLSPPETSESQRSQSSQASEEAQTTQNAPSATNNGHGLSWHSAEIERHITKTIKFTAILAPILVAIAYTASGLLVSMGVARDDCGLPRLSWTRNKTCDNTTANATDFVSSPFILIAETSSIAYLEHVFNAFILFTALTCANTNLYVASRTLFGIARNIRPNTAVPKTLAWFGDTYDNRVPWRAVWLSAAAFSWVPLLQINGHFDTGSTLGKFVEILAQMGSVSVIIVWACQCLAYIRYYHRIKNAPVQNRRPYRSHCQPVPAYLAFIGCLLILILCNSAFLWKEFHYFPFLSGYLTTIAFLLLWLGLKVNKTKWPKFDKLDDTAMKNAIEHLNELRDRSLEQDEDDFKPLWSSFQKSFTACFNRSKVRG